MVTGRAKRCGLACRFIARSQGRSVGWRYSDAFAGGFAFSSTRASTSGSASAAEGCFLFFGNTEPAHSATLRNATIHHL